MILFRQFLFLIFFFTSPILFKNSYPPQPFPPVNPIRNSLLIQKVNQIHHVVALSQHRRPFLLCEERALVGRAHPGRRHLADVVQNELEGQRAPCHVAEEGLDGLPGAGVVAGEEGRVGEDGAGGHEAAEFGDVEFGGRRGLLLLGLGGGVFGGECWRV